MLYYNHKKSNKKHYIRVLIILIFIFASLINPNTSSFSSKIASIITKPFAEITSFVSYSVNSLIDLTIGSKANRDSVNKLQTENQELKNKINSLENIVNNQDYLKQAYNFEQLDNLEKARVIMFENSSAFKNFKINKGTVNNIRVGDIILNPYINSDNNIRGALIGEVISVEPTSALVSTIYDDTYNIAFSHSKSNINGIINYRNNGILQGYLLEKTKVDEGDLIFTSGTSARFKKGIYIGKVTKSFESVDELKQIVEIKSPIDFSKLYEVYIMKGEK